MITTTLIAVALGIIPVKDGATPQTINYDPARIAADVGRYKQFTGRDGKTHVQGCDRLGRAYDLVIDANGRVAGQVGEWYVTYRVTDAG